MPTPAERRALLFLAAVCTLGATVRVARAVARREPVPAAAERALLAQQAAVDRAGARRDSTRTARARRDGGRPSGQGGATSPPRRPPRAPAVPHPTRPARPGSSGRPPERVAPVDVDRATAAELERLPWVGPALAGRIVADRDSLGPFGSLAGLDRVRGVGPALLERLGAHVTFSGTPRPSHDPPSAPRPARARRPRARGPTARRAAVPGAPADRRSLLSTTPASRAPPPWPLRQPPQPNASATC